MRAAIRASYAANMAREDCPKCGGTGWKIVEGDMELPPTLARGTEQRRGGSAAAARVAVACECVVNERATRSLERARIPSRYEHCTFESFETDYFEGPQAAAFNASLAQAKLIAEGFARDYPLTNDAGLLLIGPCGAGKTHLAIAAMKELVARGHEALFYDYRELLKEIQASYNSESSASEMSVLDPVLESRGSAARRSRRKQAVRMGARNHRPYPYHPLQRKTHYAAHLKLSGRRGSRRACREISQRKTPFRRELRSRQGRYARRTGGHANPFAAI